jgi:DNA-binding XRE family transcriptional regulator
MKKKATNLSINELVAMMGTVQRKNEIFSRLHELRRVHTQEVTRQELNLKTFGRALRRLRLDAGIMQREMAAVLGVSQSYICNCEQGDRQLGMKETLLYLNKCMGRK